MELPDQQGRPGQPVRTLSPLSPPGCLPDDDLTREWLLAVEAYRRECEAADRHRILGEPPDTKGASSPGAIP